MIMIIFEPKSLTIKETVNIISHDINMDYITNPKSTFKLDMSTIDISSGDIVVVKDEPYMRDNIMDGNFKYAREPKSWISSKIIYMGIIVDYDSVSTITTTYIYNLFNTMVDSERFTGELIIDLMKSMDKNEYLLPKLEFKTSTAGREFVKVPEDINNGKFIIMNLVDLIIECHKQTGDILSFDIKQDLDNGEFMLEVGLEMMNDKMPVRLRDNTDFMIDINVDFSAGGTKSANKVKIVSKDFHNVEAVYYATIDGELMTNFDENLMSTPIVLQIVEHDENKRYLEEAQSAIGGYKVETNITFYVDLMKHNLLQSYNEVDDENDFEQFSIGQKFILSIGGKTYKTTLTGFNYSNDSHLVKYIFGYQRNTLQSALRELMK